MKSKILHSLSTRVLISTTLIFFTIVFPNFGFTKNPPILTSSSDNRPHLLPTEPQQTVIANYCTSKSNAPWELWVSTVKFNTLNGISEKFKDYAALGYSDYTDLNTTVNKGQTYPLSIMPGLSWSGILPTAYCRVWIDFNRNDIFETTELVLEKTSQNPFTQNILIPNSAAIGNTLMRVAVKSGSYPTPCETFEKGEVEDYSVNIIANPNPCANDETPPVFTNCPQNLQKETFNDGCTYFTWNTPSVTDDCSNSTMNFISKKGLTVISQTSTQVTVQFCEPEGRDTILYTARDASGNAATCSFTLTNINGCVSRIRIVGQFPNDTTFSTPNKCISFKWQVPTKYFPCAKIANYQPWALAGTQPTMNVVRIRGNIGDSIVIDSACFPIGTTVLTYRFYTPTNGFEEKKLSFTVENQATSDADVALSIASTPSVYKQYETTFFNISATNSSETALSNVKIEFKYPPKTVSGGNATVSEGLWQEWCTGGLQCFTWTISNLAAHETATLDVPLFVLDATTPILASTRLLSSTPKDINAVNNIAHITVNSQQAALMRQQPFAASVSIQKIAPTITAGDVVVELESLKDEMVKFDVVNAIGQTVFSEKLLLATGLNSVPLNLTYLPKGIYFIQTDVAKGYNVPMKFIKL